MEIIPTKDGSFTLYNSLINENYHSTFGARQESMHVFIANGLNKCAGKDVAILEVGLGTGFNAMLTYQNAAGRNIQYTGLEPFPVALPQLKKYIAMNASQSELPIWQKLMIDLENNQVISASFIFNKLALSIQNFESNYMFDIVYFDAFAPDKQAEMWQIDVFEHLYKLLKIGGILVSYCAKGAFKRNLKEVGFKVMALPGPPGKREMTFAQKII